MSHRAITNDFHKSKNDETNTPKAMSQQQFDVKHYEIFENSRIRKKYVLTSDNEAENR